MDTDLSLSEKELLAVVDIGSNSVRMNIYNIDKKTGDFTVVDSSRAMLKLASYVNNGAMSPDGEGKLYTVMREYLAKANSMPCDRFIAFATASLRGLSTADRTIERIKRGLGVDITIISGKDEARFDYEATCRRFGSQMADRGIVIDMGGGSTEFIAFDRGEIHHLESLPIGSLALWRNFVKGQEPFPTESECKAISDYVTKQISLSPELESYGGTAYLIGGTARAISRIDAKLADRKDPPDGYEMDFDRFFKVADFAIDDTNNGGTSLKKLCSDRLTSIVPGVIAYREIIRLTGVSRAVVSLSGVREGFLASLIRPVDQEFQEF